MFKRIIENYRNNPHQYWFKRKTFGWGWVPASWQGWLVTGVYGALLFAIIRMQEKAVAGNPDSGSNFLVFALPIILLTALLIYIAYKKGEKPKWQWGTLFKNNDI